MSGTLLDSEDRNLPIIGELGPILKPASCFFGGMLKMQDERFDGIPFVCKYSGLRCKARSSAYSPP